MKNLNRLIKTHMTDTYPDNAWTVCGMLLSINPRIKKVTRRPTCINCKRVLTQRAAKEKERRARNRCIPSVNTPVTDTELLDWAQKNINYLDKNSIGGEDWYLETKSGNEFQFKGNLRKVLTTCKKSEDEFDQLDS